MPDSPGCLTQNQNLQQDDNETVYSLTQILKIVKNDPSHQVEALLTSSSCQGGACGPTYYGWRKRDFFNAADNSRDIWPTKEDVTPSRYHTRSKTQTCSRKAEEIRRLARPVTFPKKAGLKLRPCFSP